MKYIDKITGAPAAVGPYSLATTTEELVFLSGQIPLNPSSGKIEVDSIEEQTRQVLKNISTILSDLGLAFSDVVKTTIFVTDLADFAAINEIYSEVLGTAKPARSTIQVAALPLGAKIEIEVIAQKAP